MFLGLKLIATSVSFEIFLSSAEQQKTLRPLPAYHVLHPSLLGTQRQSREDQGDVAIGLEGLSQQNGTRATNNHYLSSLNMCWPGLLVHAEYSTITILLSPSGLVLGAKVRNCNSNDKIIESPRAKPTQAH